MSQTLAVRIARGNALTRAHEIREIVEQLVARDATGEVITAIHHIPAREAQWAPMPEWLRPELAAAFSAKGIAQLYTHQAAAAEVVRAGRNIVVVTPTASGKTLCYNVPVCEYGVGKYGYARALSFSDEGAGAGSACGIARPGEAR